MERGADVDGALFRHALSTVAGGTVYDHCAHTAAFDHFGTCDLGVLEGEEGGQGGEGEGESEFGFLRAKYVCRCSAIVVDEAYRC